ncbi:zinc finger protein 433-like [Anopheles nili]|uniref:zinc finger protein 433-like n=1 Tax=Anopheles nili TaxID=185578 RepID=UPI00237A6F02|nr:zinc finger protein 433-like [Anopheles nili]
MAQHLQEIFTICRLCLCQEKELLRPVKQIVGSSLFTDDIERFTGIQLDDNENMAYAFCLDCINRLQKSSLFRNLCLNNNDRFKELCAMVAITTKKATEEVENNTVDSNTDPLDLDFVIQADRIIDSKNVTNIPTEPNINIKNADTSLYSANYIKLGESILSDSDEYVESDKAFTDEDETSSDGYCYNSSYFEKSATSKTHQDGHREDISYESVTSNSSKQLCNICGQMVSSVSRHMHTHTKNAQHACPHCSIKMTDNSNLLRHIASVHLKTVVKSCEICYKGFTHYNTYHSHLLTQHGIGSTYDCKLCPRRFNHAGSLRDHVRRTHINERQYVCTTCGKKFKVNAQLKIHQRVHSTEQPFACSLCPKRFKSTRSKNMHELTHSGVLFECNHCNKSYRYKTLLSLHIRKFHLEHTSTENGED